jgi:hypothetical protein
MQTKDAIKWAGDRPALAEKLGVTIPALYQWKKFPPGPRQIQIELLSGGKLKAEPGCMDATPAQKRKKKGGR